MVILFIRAALVKSRFYELH